MSRDLLVVGIDGGTWTILQRAIDGGYMPFLSDLVQTGARGTLRSTIPSITSVAWSSFQTGRDPGDLGIPNWQIWDRKTKESHFLNSQTLGPTLWTHVGDRGLRVATLNVPVTYPPRSINGCIVTGLLTPSVDSDFTHPAELRDELLETVPDYQPPALRGWASPGPSGDYARFLKTMAQALQMRLQAAQLLIRKEAWNLFMVHFQAHDTVEHWMWHHLDPDHELHDEEICQDVFENFYRPLDDAVKQIHADFTARSDDDTGILLISDHGMQANKRIFNLSKWLSDYDLLSRKQQLAHRLRALDFLNLRRFLSRNLRKSLAKTVSPSFGDATKMFDWEATKAFALPGSTEVEIYVTAKEGTPEYSETVNTVLTELPELVDPQSGARVVERVRQKSQVWQGGKMHLMPDIVAELKDGYSYRFNLDARADTNLFMDVEPGEQMHMGMHHRDGIIVAQGPGFKKMADINPSLTDLAPTILAYLGVEVPDMMTGRVITDLVEGVERQHESDTPAEEDQEATDKTLSASEEEIIEKRLRDLGYM